MGEVVKLPGEVGRSTLISKKWKVPRTGIIDEIERKDGTIRFNVRVQDSGRVDPFIDQWFSRREAAKNFLETIIDEAEEVQG